jgi:NAD(P)-dependent dehydrogenase (short-subunit alcohol dehydrogenase family)
MSLFNLEGRVALVTGGGRGIGRGIAEGLADHGAKVVVAARTDAQTQETAEAIQAKGGEAAAVTLDISDMASIQASVDETIETFGQLDILVNNAGMNIREPLEEVTEAHYDQIAAVNQKGLFFLTQAAAKHMRPRGRGKIINIGSLTTGVGLASVSVYTGTKGAVGQLTKVHAVELAPEIQVNAICPGFILTPLTEKLWANDSLRAWGEQRCANGRLGVPEDLAGTAVFLASSASDYVTGQLIYVDGGFMAGERWLDHLE